MLVKSEVTNRARKVDINPVRATIDLGLNLGVNR